MSYFSQATRDAVCANPQTAVPAAYISAWHQFAVDLGPANINLTLTDDLLRAAFCAVLAWDLKPYGPEPPDAVDLQTLLNAPSLACDDYVRLTLYLMDILTGSAPNRYAVGWDKGAVGNHAQLFVTNSMEGLLLDPTIGLVVRGAYYDTVTSGKPIPAANKCFYGQYGGTPSIAGFVNMVRNALAQGLYKPSNALYFAPSLSFFNCMGSATDWPTPATTH